MHPHQILTVLAISIGIGSTQEDFGLKLDSELRGIYQNAEDNLEAKLAARVVDRAAPSYHSRRKGNQYSKEMDKRNVIFKNIANRLETEFKMEREEAKSFAKQALVEDRTQVSADDCFDYGTDYYGFDMNKGHYNSQGSAELCQKECQATDGCEFWTWDQDYHSACWKKSAKGESRHSSNLVSGPKHCGDDFKCNTVRNKDATKQRIILAATGYDVWSSNSYQFATDPGIKHQIFDINCRDKNGKDGFYEFLEVAKVKNCNEEYEGKTIKTFGEYLNTVTGSNELSAGGEVSASGDYWGISFSASAKYQYTKDSEMEKTKNRFEEQQLEIVIASANCLTNHVVFAQYLRPKFTRNFIKGLESLNKSLSMTRNRQESEARWFIKSFGTHYSTETDFGASMIFERRFSSRSTGGKESSSRRECSKHEAELEVSGTGYGIDAGASGNVQSKDCSGSASEGSDTSSIGLEASKLYTLGSPLAQPGEWGKTDDFDAQAVPRKRKLALITNLINEDNLRKDKRFGFEKSLDVVGIKQLLQTTLDDYCTKVLGLSQNQCKEDLLKGCGLNDDCRDGQICQTDPSSSKGFKCGTDGCTDIQETNCPLWAEAGFCGQYGGYVIENCQKSCKKCVPGSTQTCPLGSIEFRPEEPIVYSGRCFRFSKSWKNYALARATCQSHGGILWEPRSLSESKVIEDAARKRFGYVLAIGIGITDAGSEGKWKYSSTGKSLTFTNWEGSKPKLNTSYNCAIAYKGKWRDDSCSTRRYFVCEF